MLVNVDLWRHERILPSQNNLELQLLIRVLVDFQRAFEHEQIGGHGHAWKLNGLNGRLEGWPLSQEVGRMLHDKSAKLAVVDVRHPLLELSSDLLRVRILHHLICYNHS